MNSILNIDLFLRLYNLIPTKFSWQEPYAKSITLRYLDIEYEITDKEICKWFASNDEHYLIIPPLIFENIMGNAPDVLPNRNSILYDNPNIEEYVQLAILYTYIGVVDYSWYIQREIHNNRSLLPEHWRGLGGLHIIDKDIPVLKYDGTESIYTMRDFNGTYLPVGIGQTLGDRVLIESDIEYSYLWKILEDDETFQSIMFNPSNMDEEVKPLTSVAIAIISTDNWDYINNRGVTLPTDILAMIPKDALFKHLKYKMVNREMDSRYVPFIASLSNSQIQSLASDVLYYLTLQHGTDKDRAKIFPNIVPDIKADVIDRSYELSDIDLLKIVSAISDQDIMEVFSGNASMLERIYPYVSESVKEYAIDIILIGLISDAYLPQTLEGNLENLYQHEHVIYNHIAARLGFEPDTNIGILAKSIRELYEKQRDEEIAKYSMTTTYTS